jgi:hypothetical protein
MSDVDAKPFVVNSIPLSILVIARSEATKQSSFVLARWIASLRSQ